jgi:hypothetical protein
MKVVVTSLFDKIALLPSACWLARRAAEVALAMGALACGSSSAAPAAVPAAAEPVADCISTSLPPTYSDGLENFARAPNVSASQSSTGHFGWDATPALAVDGNKDGNYYGHSVAHTLGDNQAWWQVDLGAEREIQKIVVWNRTDGFGERLTNFRVIVSGGDGPVVDRTYCPGGKTFSPAMVVDLPRGTRGRSVRVQLNGQNYLQLAEVEVFGARAP